MVGMCVKWPPWSDGVVSSPQASYGVEDPEYAVTQLAQTTMRSELGKLTLDKVFRVREAALMCVCIWECARASLCVMVHTLLSSDKRVSAYAHALACTHQPVAI